MGKAKLIGYGIALLFSAGALTWIYSHIYTQGTAACEAEYAKALEAAKDESKRLADELDRSNEERNRLLRRGVQTVYLEPDPTGCADVDALPGLRGAIRDGASRPSPYIPHPGAGAAR